MLSRVKVLVSIGVLMVLLGGFAANDRFIAPNGGRFCPILETSIKITGPIQACIARQKYNGYSRMDRTSEELEMFLVKVGDGTFGRCFWFDTVTHSLVVEAEDYPGPGGGCMTLQHMELVQHQN